MSSDNSNTENIRPKETESVQVLVRLRPPTRRGRSDCVVAATSSTVRVSGQETKTYTFDAVADKDATQTDIYKAAGKPMVAKCLEGYNCCIFTYGQTGSGKTFTMWGDLADPNDPRAVPDQAGLIPRVISDLLSKTKKNGVQGQDYISIKCSMVEIHNEVVVDLLDVEKGGLNLRETKTGRVYVEHVKEQTLQNVDEATWLVNEGLANRQTASTEMNKASSRSHCILTFLIKRYFCENGVDRETTSRMHLVDLAGSERQKSSGVAGCRLKEACRINKSLSTLGHVIKSLSEQHQHKERHIHFRESKLTYLLQDSLGGNSKTMVIANVSSDYINLEESISTLRFAQRAKSIKNKVTINESTGDVSTLKEEIKQLNDVIRSLRKRYEIHEGSLPISPTGSSIAESVASSPMAQRQAEDEALLKRTKELEARNKRLKNQLHTSKQQADEATAECMRLSASLFAAQLELELEQSKNARKREKYQIRAHNRMGLDAATSTCQLETNDVLQTEKGADIIPAPEKVALQTEQEGDVTPTSKTDVLPEPVVQRLPYHHRVGSIIRRALVYGLSWITSINIIF